jgi:hypothetical protein
LEDKGWLVKITVRTRSQGGRYDSTSYRVVLHNEWAKVQDHTCRDYATGEPASSVMTSPLTPVAKLEQPVAFSAPTCRVLPISPVAPTRRSFERKALEKAFDLASVESQPQKPLSSLRSEDQTQTQKQRQPRTREETAKVKLQALISLREQFKNRANDLKPEEREGQLAAMDGFIQKAERELVEGN